MDDDVAFFESQLARIASKVNETLPQVVPLIAPSFPADHPMRKETTRFVLAGGKRLRPVMSFKVAEAYGQPAVLPHLALEVFHKYLLVHDDIIDRDSLRNGAPTLPAVFKELQHGQPDSTHFGNSIAIIAGDVLEATTQRIILESQLPSHKARQLQLLLNQATNEVIRGWCDQFVMDYEALDNPRLSQERIEESLVWVTSRYSLQLPLLFGFTMAGQPAPTGLAAFADTLGLIYQTSDDLMGIFGDQAQTGKSNARDLIQGKKTLPLWFAYQHASPSEQALLKSVIGNPEATSDMLDQARTVIAKHGRPLAEKRVAGWQADAERHLKTVAKAVPADLSRFLSGLVIFLVHRQY